MFSNATAQVEIMILNYFDFFDFSYILFKHICYIVLVFWDILVGSWLENESQARPENEFQAWPEIEFQAWLENEFQAWLQIHSS